MPRSRCQGSCARECPGEHRMGCPRHQEQNWTFPTTTNSRIWTPPASPGALRACFGFIPFFSPVHQGGRFPSLCLIFIFGFLLEWVWWLRRNPLLLEERTGLSNTPGTLGKAQGAGIPGALGFAPGVGIKGNKYKHWE